LAILPVIRGIGKLGHKTGKMSRRRQINRKENHDDRSLKETKKKGVNNM
jgi:hypothetical protein